MKKKIICIEIVSMFLLTSFIALPAVLSIGITSDPNEIIIDGDEGFKISPWVSNPDAAGTENDPYIIEGYEVSRIYIKLTEAHFIIRDCRISETYGTNLYNYQLVNFQGIQNGKISHCIIDYRNDEDKHIGIHFNTCPSPRVDSQNNIIEYCTITGNNQGIGILIDGAYNAIRHCEISEEEWCVKIFGWGNTVHNNNITNAENGLQIYPDHSPDDTYPKNTIFLNNIFNINDRYVWVPRHEKGGVIQKAKWFGLVGMKNMGNYWGDYDGTDLDNDGIGDTPYLILEGNIDTFPLMEQFSGKSKVKSVASIQNLLERAPFLSSFIKIYQSFPVLNHLLNL